jgi:MerR family transcriptional regulator, heat shock protein HspR
MAEQEVRWPRSDGATHPPAADRAVYAISVASELTGIGPQTLRLYEDKGIITPARTNGGTRRYSHHDISRIRRIAELTAAGLNLAGVALVLELEDETSQLREELARVLAAQPRDKD